MKKLLALSFMTISAGFGLHAAAGIESKKLLEALSAGDATAAVVKDLTEADWKHIRTSNPSLVDDVLKCFPAFKKEDEVVDKDVETKNGRIKGWTSYVLGRLNDAEQLTAEQLASWTANLDDKSWYPANYRNPVEVQIYALGDYADDSFGLCYCVTDKGNPSFPSFRHTHMEERFEFVDGHGVLALEGESVPTLCEHVSAQEYKDLVSSKKINPTTRYLIDIVPGTIVTIPEGTWMQLVPNDDCDLRLLIYTTPPFSKMAEVKSEWQRKSGDDEVYKKRR